MSMPLPAALAGALLEGHPEPVLVVADDGRLLGLNAAARDALAGPDGASPATLAALGIAPAELAVAAAGAYDVTLGSPPRRWRLRAGPAADGRRLLTLVPADDRTRLAERLDELAEQLEVAQAFGRLGVFRRDARTLAGHWDSHAFRIWGLPERDRAPDFATMAPLIVPEDRDEFQRALPTSLQRAGQYHHRVRIRHPDGTLRHLHTHWVVRNGPDGMPARTIGVVVDETETWDLARAHDKALRQLAAVVDIGEIGIWHHDLQGDAIRCNEVARRQFGLDAGRDRWRQDELIARVHPDDLATTLAALEQSPSQGEAVDFDCRVRRSDGRWSLVHTRRVVERDATGRPIAFLGVSMDVTSRREDARRARELLRRFNLAARTAGIGHWSLDKGAERARWSEQMYALHGLPHGSRVPTQAEWLAAHVHPDDRERVLASFRDWHHSGRPAHEIDLRIRRTDGTERQLIAHSRLERTEGAPLIFGVVIDITERRAAEAALREAAERARLIANGVGLGTWEYDIATGHAEWDDQMFRLRGLEPGGPALAADEREALVHPDDRAAVARIFELMQRDAGPIDHEFRVCWPDGGTVRWLASRSTAVCDADGRPQRRIGVNWDVTAVHAAAMEREERLAAQREVRAKSQFLARMSHELRTPLNAVLGFAQLLMTEGPGTDARLHQRRLEHIRSAGQHLLSLINDVLDLSQLEGGEVAVELRPVALAGLVQDLLPLVATQAQDAGVTLDAGVLDAVALADPTRLRQVLLNLLTNAIKYNRAGGRVGIDASTSDGVVALRVSDTGAGIAPEQMRHLFEPFNRLGAERLGVEGTGIGLAIVKALVERMGGTVHVESVVGRGTAFEIRLRDGHDVLPELGERASPQALALALTAGRVGRGGTLLYIEDNPVNTLIVGELVAQRPDLTLLSAGTGLAGIELVRSCRPHLVLLDMQLPDIDGFEVFARLRADPATARIPCIALSANAMPEDIDRAMRAGFADYWTKPLDFRTFTSSIEALFGPAP